MWYTFDIWTFQNFTIGACNYGVICRERGGTTHCTAQNPVLSPRAGDSGLSRLCEPRAASVNHLPGRDTSRPRTQITATSFHCLTSPRRCLQEAKLAPLPIFLVKTKKNIVVCDDPVRFFFKPATLLMGAASPLIVQLLECQGEIPEQGKYLLPGCTIVACSLSPPSS